MRDLRGQVSPHTGTTCVKGLLSLQRQKPSSLVSVWGTSLSSHPSSGSGVPVCSVGLPGRATSSSSDLPSQSSRWEAPGQPRVHSFHIHLPPAPATHMYSLTHSLGSDSNSPTPMGVGDNCGTIQPHPDTNYPECGQDPEVQGQGPQQGCPDFRCQMEVGSPGYPH